jgi:outer membrane lipoprotein-sorting protein
MTMNLQASPMFPKLRFLSIVCAGIAFADPVAAQMDLRPKPAAPAAPASQAITKATAPPNVSTLDTSAILQKANAYFNSVRTMTADFTQIGADGRQTTGKFYLQKPGRLRFVYDPPSPLEVIADGRSVAVRNRKLAKQDLYFIGQTPLKFLLNNQIDLARDTKVLEAKSDPNQTYIRIEDKATFGGTSRIQLFFDTKTFALTRWVVFDPQGFETKVSLAKIDLQAKPDPAHFRINYEQLDTQN